MRNAVARTRATTLSQVRQGSLQNATSPSQQPIATGMSPMQPIRSSSGMNAERRRTEKIRRDAIRNALGKN